MRFDTSLDQTLDLIACPACHQRLAVDGDALRCVSCGRLYPVEGGLPVLLVERATLPKA